MVGLAVVACGPATPVPVSPEREGGAVGRRPERADYYGGPVPEVSPTAAEEHLWTAAVGTNPSCRCTRDPRLILAARRHAADLASSGRPPADTDVEHLRFAVRALGGTDYAMQPLVTPADERGRDSLVAFALAHGDRWTHCGLGLAGPAGREVAVWIGVERKVELGPLPLRPEVGVELEVVGRTLTGGPVPIEPYLGLPDGTVRRLAAANDWSGVEGSRFAIRIPLEGEGRYDFELLVDSGRGPETAVLLPLYAGVAPEPGPVIALDAPPSEDDRPAADVLTELVNRERERAGLPALVRDPRLDRVAVSHCERMVALGFFGHRSPESGLLGDRLDRAGLRPVHSAENIARSRTVARVHRNLMESPSHRIHVVDPELTHLGIGVARDGDDVVITEIFARW